MAILGLRIGEALALRRIDCNSDFTEVKINQAIGYLSNEIGTPKSEEAMRHLGISWGTRRAMSPKGTSSAICRPCGGRWRSWSERSGVRRKNKRWQ